MVSWHVISADDGHVTEGSFSFSVGEEGGAMHSSAGNVLAEYSYSSGVIEGISLWLELLGEGCLLGALVGLAGIFRPTVWKFPEEATKMGEIVPALYTFFLSGTSLILSSVLFFFGFKAWELDSWKSAGFFPALLTLAQTVAGRGGAPTRHPHLLLSLHLLSGAKENFAKTTLPRSRDGSLLPRSPEHSVTGIDQSRGGNNIPFEHFYRHRLCPPRIETPPCRSRSGNDLGLSPRSREDKKLSPAPFCACAL